MTYCLLTHRIPFITSTTLQHFLYYEQRITKGYETSLHNHSGTVLRTTRNAKLHPITPAVTIDNRREITRDPNVKALNWEELYAHFQQVVQIQQPDTYSEAIRSDPTLSRTYIRSTTKKVNDYNSFGLENLQENMKLKGVKQN